ncbi:hypothetical protein lerEdw1_006047 [Lerista edwardsae]|nr:hypothetical protein lerEdw1_006047 [Lerista edwardsae]
MSEFSRHLPPCLAGYCSAEISQRFALALQKGQNASLECTQTNGHDYMYWYQQKARKGLQLLFSFFNQQQTSTENVPAHFIAVRPQKGHCSLAISPVKPEDSAVYFCASSVGTALQRTSTRALSATDALFCISLAIRIMQWEVLHFSVVLQLFTDVCSGITVTQRDRFLITTMGNSRKIHCDHDDSSYHTILWYRQESNRAEKQLQLIGYSIHGNEPQMEAEGYSIDRPDVKKASLSTPAQKAVGSAVYFCAASKGTVSVPCLAAAHELPSSAQTSLRTTNRHKPRSAVYRAEQQRWVGNRAAITSGSPRIACRGLQLHVALILEFYSPNKTVPCG